VSTFHALKNVNVVLAFSVKNYSMSDESDECCVIVAVEIRKTVVIKYG
jgi:hypothetical protein